MPLENDPHCPVTKFCVALVSSNGHTNKASQLIFGRCKVGKNGNHMEFHVPDQTVGTSVYHRTMGAHCDAYSEASLKGYFYKPLAMASLCTLRRFGSLRHALSNDLVSLCLQASPVYKDGGKLVKIVYLDVNQMAQMKDHAWTRILI